MAASSTIGLSPGIGRRRLLRWCGGGAALAILPVVSQAAPAFVETAAEPHHHVIFEGPDLRIMRVMLPPGSATGWHRHSRDTVRAVLRGSRLSTERSGEGEDVIQEMVTDSVAYAAYEDQPAVERVTNTSSWLSHELALEIMTHKPQGYGPADRAGAPGFAPVLANGRVKAWRLKLAPGEMTPPIVQSGPGMRVILAGERMIDTSPASGASENDIRAGDAAYLPPDTRSIANAGNAPLDIIEVELL